MFLEFNLGGFITSILCNNAKSKMLIGLTLDQHIWEYPPIISERPQIKKIPKRGRVKIDHVFPPFSVLRKKIKS